MIISVGQCWKSSCGNIFLVQAPLEGSFWSILQIGGGKVFRGETFRFHDGFHHSMELLSQDEGDKAIWAWIDEGIETLNHRNPS